MSAAELTQTIYKPEFSKPKVVTFPTSLQFTFCASALFSTLNVSRFQCAFSIRSTFPPILYKMHSLSIITTAIVVALFGLTSDAQFMGGLGGLGGMGLGGMGGFGGLGGMGMGGLGGMGMGGLGGMGMGGLGGMGMGGLGGMGMGGLGGLGGMSGMGGMGGLGGIGGGLGGGQGWGNNQIQAQPVQLVAAQPVSSGWGKK